MSTCHGLVCYSQCQYLQAATDINTEAAKSVTLLRLAVPADGMLDVGIVGQILHVTIPASLLW